ncbi:MAG: carboxypeptidase regulatory-like domain-containing protein [Gemmatimonadetes bacterium]|nr:carboxypeptidase regulatory-like domain-containing protein [Gemmatimonadota bacterium]
MGPGPAKFPFLPVSLLSLLSLLTLLAACSGGSGGTSEPTLTGTVAGQVTASGAGVPGATLTLSQGGTSRTATSSAAGAYSFAAVAAGAWTVAIAAPAGFGLATGQAASVPVTVTGGATATANFALASTLSSIRASVTAASQPRSNVTVRLYDAGATTARATQTTNASGVATFAALTPAAFDVEVVVPSGFELASGEVARKQVTTTAGAEAAVAFALESTSSGNVVEVELNGTSFQPSAVTVAVGTTVRWIYRSGGPHTVTPDGHTTWSEADLNTEGQTFEHTFAATGTYAYYCSPHRGAGMTGVITVQ